MDNQVFLDRVRAQVPLRLRTWRSDEGHLMVGYGHDLTARPALGIEAGDRICREWAEILLRMDLDRLGIAGLALELGVDPS